MAYLVNYYSQQDPLWKKKKLGFSRYSIGSDGCALTSLAMMLKGFGYDETPATLNKKLKQLGENNGFIGPLIVWGSIPVLFPKIRYKNLILCRDHDAPLAQIDASLAIGQPVLVEVDRSLSAGLQNHWVLLYAKKDDDYLMTDPWPYPSDDEETLLNRRYGFGRPVKKTITAVLWYEMQGIAPPPPTDGFYVQVAASALSGLSLRAAPTTNADILAIEASGSYLRVLEDEASARQKVGVVNQWIQVRDTDGREGYVAAWYLDAVGENDSDADADPTPDPAPEPTPTISVYVDPSVGESGLRMRATPDIGGTLVTVAAANAELLALEDEETARAKIGVFNQWLHVQDAEGVRGYVAAWYLLASPDEISDPEPEPDSDPNPDPAPDPDPEPEEKPLRVIVYPSLGRNGLRLRDQPNLRGRLLAVIRGGVRLDLLENAESARSKIGVVNRWLHVRTASGLEGYVAAWYVSPDEESMDKIAPVPDTSPLPAELTVYVSPLAAYGLRMRSQPSITAPEIKILMPNIGVTVLDAPEIAVTKIGTTGEWLHVRDQDGDEGYVAAWFVIR